MKRTTFESIEQGTDEWFRARCGIVTASTLGGLVTSTGRVANNDTSRGLAWKLAVERIMSQPDITFPSRAMQRGTALEPYARDFYAEHYAPVDEVGFMRLDTDDYALGYSPDGLVGNEGLIEIKCPSPKEHLRTILVDGVPVQYMPQVQTGLYVSGREWLDYVSYCPGADLYVTRVEPDQKWQDTIAEAVTAVEVAIREAIDTYTTTGAEAGRIHTEWFDPFEEEEMEF